MGDKFNIKSNCRKLKNVHKMILDYVKSINCDCVLIKSKKDVIRGGFYWIEPGKFEYKIYEVTNRGYILDSFVFELMSSFKVQKYGLGGNGAKNDKKKIRVI